MESLEKTKIYVGMGSCGLAAGAQKVYNKLLEVINRNGQDISLIKTSCIGICYKEVLVDVQLPNKARVTYGDVTVEDIEPIIESHVKNGEIYKKKLIAQLKKSDKEEVYEGIPLYEDLEVFKKQQRIVLRNCGIINPESIDEYVEREGYMALEKALTSMTPADVREEVKKSGLRGRGGGGFPTGLKWEFCSKNPSDHRYMICNADEGDPGAFMDRSVLEGDPHAVLEGMMIAGYGAGCDYGYIYCRAEYPLAIKRLKLAITQAKEKGYLGHNILGSGFNFDIFIKEGAGAFVCGEETALIASIEGQRGMPRPKPPFPAVKGLWSKPSNINNVETFANVARIILQGGDWFASIGTEKSKGTKVFALTGKINNSGLVEVPMGITLREVVEKIGGGIPKKKKFKGAQLGGPSGGCIPMESIDTSIDYDSLIAAGAMMGSGGVVIMDEATCMVDTARFFLSFTQSESCGKCVPCRVGTKAMLDILNKICAGEGKMEDIDRLIDLGQTVKNSSLCGLGMTAPNPVLSTIRYFRDEYEAHIKDKKCPAHVCVPLIEFVVVEDKCKKCGVCKKACPADAITWEKGQLAFIDLNKCTKCRSCIVACPFDSIY